MTGSRPLRRLALAAVLAVGACGGDVPPEMAASEELSERALRALSQIDGALELAEISEPVEVLRDRWGVPHIYARTVDDLFFAQGLVAAQDRLWQMEWWRRYGEGRLAEILGPVALPHDRFARLLRYRGDLEAEYASYHPEGRRIITAFTRGVNAWIRWVNERDNPPVEFQLTGIRPEPWSPEVPLLRMAGLAMTGNNLREIDLALRARELGLAAANGRDAPDPWHELRWNGDLDLALIPEDFRARVLGDDLPPPPLLERFREMTDLFPAASAMVATGPLLAGRAGVADRADGAGSNNWVVAPGLSTTGAPLLANDPHRGITLPSLRYLVHLNGPGWNVIGAGEPALPGVAIGHNERIGWGLTIVGIDQGDIYVEKLNPDAPDEVWHDGRWEPLEVVVEEIPVRGEAPRRVELKYSHHGPILFEDPDNNVAYALRTVLTEPGTAGYLGSLRVDQASDWDSYVEALEAWKVPSENMIYADVEGNIGWLAAGLTPVRDGWVGRLPVPGSGEFEWQGFRPTRELPQQYNPSREYIATANHNIMPSGYSPPLGYRWADPTRYERIDDVLAAGGPFTLADFRALQYDVFSPPAARRVARLAELTFADPLAERARQLLAVWDARLTVDSAAAALYKAWVDVLEEAGIDPEAPDPTAAAESLRVAVARVEGEQGQDWTAWRWGRANVLRREHALVDSFDLPPVERAGDGTTVNVGRPTHGASFREILDLADWDRSVATSTPGQSGQPRSPFYRNLGRNWEEGEYFPLLFSRDAVVGSTAHRLLLLPLDGPR